MTAPKLVTIAHRVTQEWDQIRREARSGHLHRVNVDKSFNFVIITGS